MKNISGKGLSSRKWLASILVLAILVSVATTVAIASTGRQVTGTQGGINIVIDGNHLNLAEADQPVVIDGRTFLPVRALGDAIGLGIDWDGNTRTVIITTGDAAPSVTWLDTLPIQFEGREHGVMAIGSNRRGDVNYERGVEVRPGFGEPPILLYQLNGNYSRFISDMYSALGGTSARVVTIYGDGRLLYTSPPMVQGTLTQSIDIDVSGVSVLRIAIGGGSGNITFADARLIR